MWRNALRYFPKLYVESLVDVFCQTWTEAPEIQHLPRGGIALHSFVDANGDKAAAMMPKERPIKQIIRVTIFTIDSRAHQIYDYQHYQNHITSITYWTSQSPALIIWESLRGQSYTSGSWHDPTSRHNQLKYITTLRHMHNYFSNSSLIGTSKDSVEVSWPTLL